VGRGAIEEPFYWRKIDSKLFGEKDPGELIGCVLLLVVEIIYMNLVICANCG
jgi:hypothetical protein